MISTERGLLTAGRFSSGVMYPRHIPPCGGGTRICLAALQPSLDVAATQGTPVLSLKASAVGLPAKGLVLFSKRKEKG